MESQSVLSTIERERNVYQAVEYIEKYNDKSLDAYLRVLFILLDFLVDGQYTEEEHLFFSSKIMNIYNDARAEYSNHNEFLFFSGIMIYIAEWYFGITNTDVATSFLYKAMHSDSENIIYQWGFFSIIDQRVEINTEKKFRLSKKILDDKLIVEWIKQKGLLGEYLLGLIQSTYELTKFFTNDRK